MTDDVPTPATVAAQVAPRQLTQAHIDSEVTKALRAAKPADYDEVRAAAEAAGGLEQQISELEKEIAATRLDSLKLSIATRFGVSEQDRTLLMTGADEATLLAQAERLGQPSRPLGNVAPREGGVVKVTENVGQREMREFVNDLFGGDPY